MGKHTPGPWEARPFDNDRRKNVGVTGGSENIATVWTKGAANEADARLIAAAPELLDACKNLIATYEVGSERQILVAVERIQAAVAKAEGRD